MYIFTKRMEKVDVWASHGCTLSLKLKHYTQIRTAQSMNILQYTRKKVI